MGKPTGYLVEVQGVGMVPLWLTDGVTAPRLYGAYQTAYGPGKHDFPKEIESPEDLQALGFATVKKRDAVSGKSPMGKSHKPKPEKPDISEKIPAKSPTDKTKKKDFLDGVI